MKTNGETLDSVTGEIVTTKSSVMESMIRAEVDMAITTAKQYPRDITIFKQSVARVIADPIIAAGCGYLIPRGKGIEGPSVRLAEIMAPLYGNMSVGTRTLEVGARSVRIQAVAKDYESNFQTTMEIERPIIDRNGKRYDDTMINTTIMAAQAIGFRNVVFKAIPREYVMYYHEQAKEIALQDPELLLGNRIKWVEFWEARGISRERILAKFKVTALKNLSGEDVVSMNGYANAMKDGEVTLDEIFPPEDGPGSELDMLQPETWGSIVNDALKKSKLRKAKKESIIRSGIKDQKTAEEMIAIINVSVANKAASKKPKTGDKTPERSASADNDAAPDGEQGSPDPTAGDVQDSLI